MTTRLHLLALASTMAILSAGCGGGGGSGGGGGGPGVPATLALSGVVADGLIQGATVCYDLNDNNRCDTDEPRSSATGADGGYALNVPASEAGKHAVIADIPATAIDQDNPGVPVGQAYVLKAPAQSDITRPLFVSPLTNAVVEVMIAAGTTDPAAAIAQVQAALGLTVSPLDNFIAAQSTGTAEQQAAAVQAAKTAQVLAAAQQEIGRIGDAAGVSAADQSALLTIFISTSLGNVAQAIAENSTPPASIAQTVVSTQGITTSTVAAQASQAVALVNATPDTTPVTGPFVTVRDFRYTDANNWSYRLFTGTGTADPDGQKYANEVRRSVRGGVAQPFNRDVNYFDTTTGAWYDCPSSGYKILTYTDATATTPQASNFCRTYRSSNRRVDEDIAGSSIRSVVERIRASGIGDYATWGPSPSQVDASLTFPAGAVLRSQITTDTDTPDGMVLSSRVRVLPDGRPFNDGLAFASWPFAANLEQVIGRYYGSYASLSDSQVNGNVTLQIAEVPDATVTDPNLQKRAFYRVAFQATSASGGDVRYFLCRRNDPAVVGNNFTNGCTRIGDATYSIEVRGNGRLLRLAGVPVAVTAYRGNTPLYVERAGTVFFGFKDTLKTTTTFRLNGSAWDALRAALPGVTPHADPVAPVAPDAASWLRDMREGVNASGQDTFSIRVINSVGTTSGTFNEVRLNFVDSNTVTFARSTLYWNGSAWRDADGADQQCPSNGVNLGTWSSNPRGSVFCGLFRESIGSVDVDIGGKTVTAVLSEMRLYSGFDNGNNYDNYGPTVLTSDPEYAAFTTAVFPPGSRLRYQVNTLEQGPDQLFLTTPVMVGASAATSFASLTTAFGGGFGATSPNGGNTLGIYQYQSKALPATGTTGLKRIRVAMEAVSPTTGNARFYACDQDSTTFNTTGCMLDSTSSYNIAPQGGKDVLRFAAMPSIMSQQAGFSRLFVLHNGVVYAGSAGVVGYRSYNQRLNQVAYESLFSIFGVTIPAQTATAAP